MSKWVISRMDCFFYMYVYIYSIYKIYHQEYDIRLVREVWSNKRIYEFPNQFQQTKRENWQRVWICWRQVLCSIFLHIGFALTLVWDHLEPAQLRVYISNQQTDVISKDVTSTMNMSQCLDDSDLKIGNTQVNMFKTKPGFVFFGERSGGSSVTISWEADWR